MIISILEKSSYNYKKNYDLIWVIINKNKVYIIINCNFLDYVLKNLSPYNSNYLYIAKKCYIALKV